MSKPKKAPSKTVPVVTHAAIEPQVNGAPAEGDGSARLRDKGRLQPGKKAGGE